MAKVVAIIGDPREKGTSRDLFQKYLAFFQEHPTIEVKIYDIRELAFDPNLPEGYRTEQTPEIIALKNDVRPLIYFYFLIRFGGLTFRLS